MLNIITEKMPDMSENHRPPDWLKNAVFYQIYPQSFFDSNADGIGDLPGIVAKLDYVASLGVTALWINPCFDSPFQDAGYDVRDYFRIAPRYGTLEDLQRLFAEAHRRNLRVLLDLVPGHTSIECEMFKKSAAGELDPECDPYIWTTGCHARTHGYNFISGYGNRNGYYLANFFYCQPALNFGFTDFDEGFYWQQPTDAPAVLRNREFIRQVMEFYLKLGCDGFRVDMAESLVRGRAHRAEGLRELWNYYREWLDREFPEAVLASEWGNPAEAIAAGFDLDFLLAWDNDGDSPAASMFRRIMLEPKDNSFKPELERCFFCRKSSGNSRCFTEELKRILRSVDGRGYCAPITGNHDLYRISGRRSIEDLKVLYSCIFTLPGVPFLYYGDELGMRYLEHWPHVEGSYERSGSRTPMQWDHSPNAGFSAATAEQLYLPIDPEPGRPCVSDQEAQPESLLNFTRRLITLHREHPALGGEGNFRVLCSEYSSAPFVYERSHGNERFVIALNPGLEDQELELALIGETVEVLRHGSATLQQVSGGCRLKLGGVSTAIWQLR